jgi:hypothetical protein
VREKGHGVRKKMTKQTRRRKRRRRRRRRERRRRTVPSRDAPVPCWAMTIETSQKTCGEMYQGDVEICPGVNREALTIAVVRRRVPR